MKVLAAIKWTFILLVCLAVGILAGFPAGKEQGEIQKLTAEAESARYPVVKIAGAADRDYQAESGSVPQFVGWGHGPVAASFERHYRPGNITQDLQRSFYIHLTDTAIEKGASETAIDNCAMRALNEANSEESNAARAAGMPYPQALTLLVYAEKAQYFGQDVWCFLCLSTVGHDHGTVRVIVATCEPSYGLVHTEEVGSY